jgi:pyruvate kinase
MILEGMDMARINAVHDTEDVHHRRLVVARRVAKRCRVRLKVLLDLPGPKHRLGKLPTRSLELHRGSAVYLGTKSGQGCLPVADKDLLPDLRVKDVIYLADGTVRLVVIRHEKSRVRCQVEIGGTVRSGSGMNMPLSQLSVHLPTEADKRWIRFACREGIDWLGISFVRTPRDVTEVRHHVRGGICRPRLIAKIEKRDALIHLESIARVADGLMVARGDLGVETPLEAVPLAQKRIISVGRKHRKPVITATQMLESMVENPTPTRAEVTDVANAVLDGTNAVMLSAETAIGAYPAEAVNVLNRVIRVTERSGRAPLTPGGSFTKRSRA